MDKIYVFWILLAVSRSSEAHSPTVTLPDGELHGIHTRINISEATYDVSEYLGIPFAQPPLGQLRFRKPERMGPLGVFMAQQYGPSCMQMTSGILPDQYDRQSEDCLTLNVFAPGQQADMSSGHAVLIWIHGGGFDEGSSESYSGTYLAALGNIIVVTFNYRLNAFGFLSTSDEAAPGNFGLWDQRLVLEWVQENIRYFGGDSSRVTIGGESAGASSCRLQATSRNYGLFENMILQSAASLKPYNMNRIAVSDVHTLAENVGCTDRMSGNQDVVDCLRQKSASELVNSVKELKLHFRPIVDGDMLHFDPSSILDHSSNGAALNEELQFFQSLNIISGFNSHDGAKTWLLIFGRDAMEYFYPSLDDFDHYLQMFSANYLRKEYSDEFRTLIKAEYTNWTAPYDPEAIRLQLTKLAGDMLYGVPTMENARLHQMSSAARHFLYHFEAEPTMHFLPTQSWIHGANHADELRFVFGIDRFFPGGDARMNWEIALSRNIIMYWASFVKSGNPNPATSSSTLPSWPAYDINGKFYMKLEQSLSNTSVGQYLYAREENFWLDVLPELVEAVKRPDNTVPCTSAAHSAPYQYVVIVLSVLIVAV